MSLAFHSTNDQESAIATGLSAAVPPGQTAAAASTSAGFGNPNATAVGSSAADAQATSQGSPVPATASTRAIAFTNSATGVYGSAVSAQASSGDVNSSALAIGLGGLPQSASFSDTGGDFTPELHLRYDYQTEGNWLFGAELDLSMAGGGSGSARQIIDSGTNGFGSIVLKRGFETNIDALGSARLRLGYAMGDYLIYGTGGVAYANYTATATTTGSYDGLEASASQTDTGNAFGGVIGGGVSTFVADNATVSLEGLYYRFDDKISLGGQNDMSVGLDNAFSLMMKFSIRAN